MWEIKNKKNKKKLHLLHSFHNVLFQSQSVRASSRETELKHWVLPNRPRVSWCCFLSIQLLLLRRQPAAGCLTSLLSLSHGHWLSTHPSHTHSSTSLCRTVFLPHHHLPPLFRSPLYFEQLKQLLPPPPTRLLPLLCLPTIVKVGGN